MTATQRKMQWIANRATELEPGIVDRWIAEGGRPEVKDESAMIRRIAVQEASAEWRKQRAYDIVEATSVERVWVGNEYIPAGVQLSIGDTYFKVTKQEALELAFDIIRLVTDMEM